MSSNDDTNYWQKVERMPLEEKIQLCAHLLNNLDEDPVLLSGLLELVDDPVIVARSFSNGLGGQRRAENYAGDFNGREMDAYEIQELCSAVIDNLATAGISLREVTPFLRDADRTCQVMNEEAARIEAEIEADSAMRNGM